MSRAKPSDSPTICIYFVGDSSLKDKFVNSVREKQKAGGTPESGLGVLWPPLRAAVGGGEGEGAAGDPRALCLSGVLHGALLGVLHRGVHRRAPDAPAPHAPPDHVLALAVYLLHVAADLHAERATLHQVPTVHR